MAKYKEVEDRQVRLVRVDAAHGASGRAGHWGNIGEDSYWTHLLVAEQRPSLRKQLSSPSVDHTLPPSHG